MAVPTLAAEPTPFLWTLPGGIVVVINPAPAPKKENPPPKALPPVEPILLTPEKYRELLDRNAKLQALLDARVPNRPRNCFIEGKVEQKGTQSVVRLKVVYQFSTTEPRSVISLGGRGFQAIEAKYSDGKPALLLAVDEGLAIEAETPGDYTLTLELESSLTSRINNELGFEIGLPAAPITTLSFVPPAGVPRINIVSKLPKATGAANEIEQVSVERLQQGKITLGAISQMTVSWANIEKKAPVPRSAESEIALSLTEDDLLIETRLRLQGSATEWQFTAPATADVSVSRLSGLAGTRVATELPMAQAAMVVRPDPGQNIWKIQFRDPPTFDLQVAITYRLPRPKQQEVKGIPIGPFAVLNVGIQSGVIRIRPNANYHMAVTPKGDIRREGDDDTYYRYSYPADLKVAPEALFLLGINQLPGFVNGRTRHELRLTENGWRLKSEISVSPTRSELNEVEIEMPNSFLTTVVEPGSLVEGFVGGEERPNNRRTIKVRLVTPKRSSFNFTLEGEYTIPPGASTANLGLPRLIGITERASEVIVIAPDRFDLRGSVRTWEKMDAVGTWPTTMLVDPSSQDTRIRTTLERAIARVDIAWQLAPAVTSAKSVCEIDIFPTATRVQQKITYRFTGRPPERVRLRGGRDVRSLRVTPGIVENIGDRWELVLPGDPAKELTFTISYVLNPSASPDRIELGIFLPEELDTEQIARVWDSKGRTLQLDDSSIGWRNRSLELVGDRDRLPSVRIMANGDVAPPTLLVSPSTGTSNLDLIAEVDTVSVEARLNENMADISARFLVRESNGTSADFQMPSGVSGAEVIVAEKSMGWLPLSGERGDRLLHVPLPAQRLTQLPIEIRYRLPIGVGKSLLAPRPVRDSGGDLLWNITNNPGEVGLVVGGQAPGSWSPRNLSGLLSYFGGDRGASREFQIVTSSKDQLKVVAVHKGVWVTAWSLVAFLLGMFLVFLPSKGRQLVLLLLLAVTAVGAQLFSQIVSLAVFGAIPGIIGFLMMLGMYRFLRQRFRYRVNHLPGFSRTGSSFARPSGVRSREMTTVDHLSNPGSGS